jgi:Zn-dependent protease
MTGSVLQQAIQIALMVLAFVPAIVLHECAHGFMAYKLGDNTAKSAGRLTLNPLAHIDPFGTVLLPAILIGLSVIGANSMIFGYAKPVPYNPRYFKDIRKGELLVGLAGPASNILMALAGAAIAWLGDWVYLSAPDLGVYIWYFGVYFTQVNLALAFFNLIPLPPLDGSSIIAPFLSDSALRVYYKVQRYSMFILMLLILVLPSIIHFDVIGWYLQITAGNIANLILP